MEANPKAECAAARVKKIYLAIVRCFLFFMDHYFRAKTILMYRMQQDGHTFDDADVVFLLMDSRGPQSCQGEGKFTPDSLVLRTRVSTLCIQHIYSNRKSGMYVSI